jgi:cytochrome c553
MNTSKPDPSVRSTRTTQPGLLVGCLLAGVPLIAMACAQVGGINIPATWEFQSHQHFLRSSEIRQSLIHGDLAGARRAAVTVAEHSAPTELPSRAGGLLDETRSHARDLAAAASITEASIAAGAMAASCGACHTEGRVGPRYVLGPTPARPEAGEHGQTFSWALARLWQGLVAPSDSAWGLGLEGLRSATLTDQELETLGIDVSWVEEPLTAFRALVAASEEAGGAADRPAFFARAVTACANCHEEAS